VTAPPSDADPRVLVEGVRKDFARGRPAYGSLRDSLAGLFRRRPRPALLHALRDVSLVARPGDLVSVIGPNGAGKSTLLKVVARITPPDQGRVRVRGRLSALIEVGAGFHPELTGAENVLLHGAVLGFSRREMRRALPGIAEFAGVADALDTPLKFFSTGLYARLGFAVAVHADPDVLLVDEVLSVGDEAFRERCFTRIDALRRRGTTLLFVSHDLPLVERVSSHALWLDAGSVAASGDPRTVVAAYRTRVPAPA
jgi:ABC-type polysaccharide/polyol phosphate transport system ATPase subunit